LISYAAGILIVLTILPILKYNLFGVTMKPIPSQLFSWSSWTTCPSHGNVVVVEESFRLVHFGLLLNESRCASKIKGIEKAVWKKSRNVNSIRGEAMRDERNNEEMDSVCDRYISHAFGRNRPFQERVVHSWAVEKCKPFE
jgi:hypothetical protein